MGVGPSSHTAQRPGVWRSWDGSFDPGNRAARERLYLYYCYVKGAKEIGASERVLHEAVFPR